MEGKFDKNMMIRKIKHIWINDKRIGVLKRRLHNIIIKIFKISNWHEMPINFKPYAIDIVNYINEYIKRTSGVLEIGCGLGDIIGNIDCSRKYGCDIDEKVARVASVLHPSVNFAIGSMKNIKIDENLDVVIMVNFIHRIPTKELKECIENMIVKNKVKMFVIDVFCRNEGTCYEYSHDGKVLFGPNYKRIRKSKCFEAAEGAVRYIEYWERVENKE